ncbi:hypothetical protein BDN72DRAFT_565780 [Pluteus cervinus]|uniref:Uncharacterized protein n=1 Tax=Pluteus cervinus TaxID=181527 RepID=A0ACD3AWB3_9AGAR|nr:hypothetical protein BDN72DRAFT_565780 [Pluteus cervinus]
MSSFPAELIENILEHAYGEYKPLEKPVILHQCAQVCRTWRTIAQSLIFSELLLSIGNPQIKILQENDSPRHLVRRVWVRIVEMEIIPWMLGPRSAFDLTRLTTLRTSDRTNHLEGYALVQELVEQCASTVQDLMVDPPTMYAVLNPDLSPECVLNPTKLSSLRTIRIAIIQEMEDYTNFIPWLIALFSSFAVDSKLEEILLPCVFPEHSLDVETGAKEDTIGEYGWEALDDLLSTSIQTLKRVVISVYGNYGVNPQGDHSLGIQFRTAFPRLTERGMLEIMGSLEPGCVSSEDCWWRLVDKANS